MLVGVAILSGPSAQAAQPRCRVVPSNPAPHGKLEPSPQPNSATIDPQTLTVNVPRLICRPTPQGTSIKGDGGGNLAGGGSAGGGGTPGGKGRLPFTGLDLETYLALGAALVGAGGVLARRRRSTRKH
jgi:LPXTG-motif cell wall-anchored protein